MAAENREMAYFTCVFKVFKLFFIVASRLEEFRKKLKTLVKLILDFTRPHAITHTNLPAFDQYQYP
jgi:hypothetical protein